MQTGAEKATEAGGVEKCKSGIFGFDEITEGGLPRGRSIIVAGGAGCGKTLFGMQFIVKGAVEYGEPGIFAAFEETAAGLAENVSSLGWNIYELINQNRVGIEEIRIDPSVMQEAGEYNLEGLFVRLGSLVDSVGTKRIVLDSIEALFGAYSKEHLLRAEFRRLLQWLKQKGLTAVVTAEKGKPSLTRYGLEEYVSDCVIELTQTLHRENARRHLQVLKYRGSSHDNNVHPFLVGEDGIQVYSITSVGLNYPVYTERTRTGISGLDTMFGGGRVLSGHQHPRFRYIRYRKIQCCSEFHKCCMQPR
ncbi:MAG: ATPase domain-containing protein [Spirochaetota bacterium]